MKVTQTLIDSLDRDAMRLGMESSDRRHALHEFLTKSLPEVLLRDHGPEGKAFVENNENASNFCEWINRIVMQEVDQITTIARRHADVLAARNEAMRERDEAV